MNPLAVISQGDASFVLGLHHILQGFERSAERYEVAGQPDDADECWEFAAIIEEQLECALVELLDEGGTSTTCLTEDDEAEYGFGESLYDTLLRISAELYGRKWGHSEYEADGVDPWPEEPDVNWLGARDMADQLLAGGRLWTRRPLADPDDPRRPADSKRACVTGHGRVCGPVYDVWESDGKLVGPATLLSMGAQPARTVEQVAARRLGEVVRRVLSDAKAPQEAVEALSDADARALVDDVWSSHAARIAVAREWNKGHPERPDNASAWLAARREAP